jgi:30S ribosomal protein S31
MGKGDKKTRRGKITIKSFGNTRPRKKKKVTPTLPVIEEKPVIKAPVKEAKKPAVKKEAKTRKPAAKAEEHPKKKEKEKKKE